MSVDKTRILLIILNFQSHIQPGNLIKINQKMIQESFGPNSSLVDVELTNGVYSISSGQQQIKKILYFNATTGKPI